LLSRVVRWRRVLRHVLSKTVSYALVSLHHLHSDRHFVE
jgi:hypothetical protein